MAPAAEQKRLFKDWIDRDAALRLADQVSVASAVFERERFLALATGGLERLEFQGRVRQFAAALRESLPLPVPESLRVLAASLPPAQEDCESVTDGWLQWPLGQFIAECGAEHFEAAFPAMLELTKRFSSEFAVRPFVEADPSAVCERLLAHTDDPNPHVRRWCSEGVRTRLPWGKKLSGLVADPSPVWPILEALRDDPEPYVRRSVANNLNDLAKDHPGEILRLCRRWMKDATPARRWIVNHGLRSLVKQGDPGALAVVGYTPPEGIEARLSLSPRRIAVGGSVELRAEIANASSRRQELMIDFAVHYVRGGGRTGVKVFKWKRFALEPGESSALAKRLPVKPTTIRALYPGRHRVEIQINGVRLHEATFQLALDSGSR